MFIVYFLVGILLLFVVWNVLNGAANASPRKLATGIKVGAGIGGGLLALWLLVSSPFARMLLFPGLMGPIQRWLQQLFSSARSAGGPAPGQSSGVETGYLRMNLDHDSGTIDGTILRGRLSGRRLGELDAESLVELLSELRLANDEESVALLEAYLDRVHPQWRDATGAGSAQESTIGAAQSAKMSPDEAYRVLGLSPGADHDQIRAAHRRLMVKLHPDQGGSDYLAAKINQARDILLHL